MLYDDFMPKGEYIAHYGVPMDQWSAEAQSRHRRKKNDAGSVVDDHRSQAAAARSRYNSQYTKPGESRQRKPSDYSGTSSLYMPARRREEEQNNNNSSRGTGRHVYNMKAPSVRGTKDPIGLRNDVSADRKKPQPSGTLNRSYKRPSGGSLTPIPRDSSGSLASRARVKKKDKKTNNK